MKNIQGLYWTLLIVCHLKSYSTCWAQDSCSKKDLAIITGVGNYELVHAGLRYAVTSSLFLEGAVGIKPWEWGDNRYVMQYIAIGTPMFSLRSQSISTFLQSKLIHWNYDDDFVNVSVIAINPEMQIATRLCPNWGLTGNAGIVYNMAVSYERKTYEEIGWFNPWDASFSVQLQYWIK